MGHGASNKKQLPDRDVEPSRAVLERIKKNPALSGAEGEAFRSRDLRPALMEPQAGP